MKSASFIVIAFSLVLGCPKSEAATAYLAPAADTTLIENQPNNNMGGQPFVNAGTTQNYTKNRGLFRFDPAAQIPRGSKVTSAVLVLEVTKEPAETPAASTFHLHRVLKPWGEGNKISGLMAGWGQAATEGEATWNHRFALTTNTWAEPGGLTAVDYASTSSSSRLVYGVGDSPYFFDSSPQMVADVQLWLDSPAQNFGWILISDGEATPFTARRFGSREAGIDAPRLEVEFIPAPEITAIERFGAEIRFSFVADENRAYVVERKGSLTAGPGWQALTNIPPQPQTQTIHVSDLISTNASFYRVSMP